MRITSPRHHDHPPIVGVRRCLNVDIYNFKTKLIRSILTPKTKTLKLMEKKFPSLKMAHKCNYICLLDK